MSRDRGIADIDVLIIDGDNLLHDVRGSRDEGGVAWLLPRLSGWRPEQLHIIIGLDGHAPQGEPSRKKATRGIDFHHSGRRSADDMIINLLRSQPYARRSRTVVVTRDRALQARANQAGGATRSTDWLMGLVTGTSQARSGGQGSKPVGIGQGSPPRRRPADATDDDGDDRSSWQPGRGATKKKGNPKRSPKQSRQR